MYLIGKRLNYSENIVKKISLFERDNTGKFIEKWLDGFLSSSREFDNSNVFTLKIEMGNICFSIKSINRRFIKRIRKRYKDFNSSSVPAYIIRCRLSAKEYVQSLHKISSFLTIDPQEINIIDCSDEKLLILLPDIIALFDINEKRIDIIIQRTNEVSFDSLLRIAYSLAAVKGEGFLLHSAGLKADGCGFVFFGPSQSGKSTIARLAEDNYEVLSDELTIIRKIEGDFRVFGTPFIGTNSKKGVNSSSQLKALFFPQKDTSTYLKKMEKNHALRHLLSNTLFFFNQPNLTEQILNICNHLVDNILCYEMHFTLDNNFLRCINDFH